MPGATLRIREFTPIGVLYKLFRIKLTPTKRPSFIGGDKVRKFSLSALKNSNNAIKDVEEQYWGKIPADSYTFSIPIDGVTYVQCSTAADTSCKRGHLLQFPIKPGSVKLIPATRLSQKLAGKMLVFAK